MRDLKDNTYMTEEILKWGSLNKKKRNKLKGRPL